ncbi:hypothetical protein [Leptolyngbya sp. FACHB-17]|uniref:hypothetical protein n=1 Tax=unclassified Leptolyngbya TaxID=2650499 RepID=UPI0016809962|nr:hypothetical protein [Leptolyngbya sp. FACHB-17]MBD2081631.1 hypothetical protein [Leptolyngbya sp. FACHB-17]
MLLSSRINVWHMVPIALGLHGLMFIVPVPSQDAIVERQNPKTVRVANVPNPSSKATTPPTPKAKASPKPTPQLLVKPRVVEPPATLSQPKPSVSTPIVATPTPSPVASPSPVVSPSPTPTTSPTPTPSPSPKDALQLDGATPGCNGREGCWEIAETQGRMISKTLEKQLQDQGYQVTEKDINEDVGMRVYQVEKSGTQPYYLHFIWSDRGTAYVRHAQILSRSELEAIANL